MEAYVMKEQFADAERLLQMYVSRWVENYKEGDPAFAVTKEENSKLLHWQNRQVTLTLYSVRTSPPSTLLHSPLRCRRCIKAIPTCCAKGLYTRGATLARQPPVPNGHHSQRPFQ